MILSCNSCGKKFVVPDNAITASGRMVQCGSCGNKWRQYPLNEIKKTPVTMAKILTRINKTLKCEHYKNLPVSSITMHEWWVSK